MRPFGTGMFDSMSEFLNDCPVPRERIERAKDLVKAAKPGARLPKEVLKIILFAGFAYHKVNLAIETFQDKPLRRDLLQANDMEGYQKIVQKEYTNYVAYPRDDLEAACESVGITYKRFENSIQHEMAINPRFESQVNRDGESVCLDVEIQTTNRTVDQATKVKMYREMADIARSVNPKVDEVCLGNHLRYRVAYDRIFLKYGYEEEELKITTEFESPELVNARQEFEKAVVTPSP